MVSGFEPLEDHSLRVRLVRFLEAANAFLMAAVLGAAFVNGDLLWHVVQVDGKLRLWRQKPIGFIQK